MSPAEGGGSRRRWIVGAALTLLLAVGVTIVWRAGGLEAAAEKVDRIGFGTIVEGQRFALDVRGAAYATVDPLPSFGDPEPGRFLVLDLKVENVSRLPATVRDLTASLFVRVGGYEMNRFGDISGATVVRDGRSSRSQLHPGLGESVRVVYKVPERVPVPERVDVRVRDEEYTGGFGSDLPEWRPGEDLAVVSGRVRR
ncbi:hypothetical protein HNP84_000476 [Thermocatellispora tengchongensis]|uniref:DUF4352 domain-containing protein n=1 Tax=Thermocatellispora tengchongensis TaxID=1073253 RepID=A0A840NT85_9ACTN|nr:hypothetical protein [Thermocatellispora tengchongensis]MBB5130788.1 hypothetical protein [Thermocatellispora tengchongensis]